MTQLSDVFKYISQFRHAGHQVGRKVGDMLEIITYAAIQYDENLKNRLHVEPKLFGFSGAGHKVEFVLTNDETDINERVSSIDNPSDVIAFIECKKVGVEQTIHSSFKNNYQSITGSKYKKVPLNTPFKVSFSPHGGTKQEYQVTFDSHNNVIVNFVQNPSLNFTEQLTQNHRIIFALFDDGTSEPIRNSKSLRDYNKKLADCRILEIESTNTDNAIALLNSCLKGPQTPEKAKQSSFVALDVRKLRFGSFDLRADEKEMVSVLVITEFSHWEEKSQNMITACIDKNLVVSDDIIIEALQNFEKVFGADFYSKITKENYEKNVNVRKICDDLVASYKGKIFLDISDNQMKKFSYKDNSFEITS